MTQERSPERQQENYQYFADRAAEAVQGHKDFKKTSKYWPDRSQEHKDIHNNRIKMWVQERDKYQAMADALNPTSVPELDPETIPELDLESDSEFWDEVDELTPPPEERNAGDILEIIDAVNEIQDKETPSEFNVNSNSVTSDQTADWKTSINNSGKRAQINADVINDNYIVNRNAFNPDDPTGKAANNFNFNTSDATQDLQWETDITNTGDDAVINAGVYNSLGNFNDNRYGESFSQAGDQDSEDIFRYISSSDVLSPEDTEGNVTNDVSFIRDRNDIGTKFLNQFRSNLFA